MLMNAGREFQHEELVPEEGKTLCALQIFIRPEQGGMKPRVQVHRFVERKNPVFNAIRTGELFTQYYVIKGTHA